jgi:hypothetical protein
MFNAEGQDPKRKIRNCKIIEAPVQLACMPSANHRHLERLNHKFYFKNKLKCINPSSTRIPNLLDLSILPNKHKLNK